LIGFSFDPKTLCTCSNRLDNQTPIFQHHNRRVIRNAEGNSNWWTVQIPIVLTKGTHYFEFTVLQSCVTIGVVDEHFLNYVKNFKGNVEIGVANTYSLGYAFTGNLANCGTWIYRGNEEFNPTTGSPIVIGMYVDMDKGFIQYYHQGNLQQAVNHIHTKQSAPLKLIPTVTLYYNTSSIELNVPPKYDIRTLNKHEVAPHEPTAVTLVNVETAVYTPAQEISKKKEKKLEVLE